MGDNAARGRPRTRPGASEAPLTPARDGAVAGSVAGDNALLQSHLLGGGLRVDPEQGIKGADTCDTRDDQYHADPPDGVLKGEEDVPDQKHSEDDADDAIDLADVALEKIHFVQFQRSRHFGARDAKPIG